MASKNVKGTMTPPVRSSV